MIDGCVEWRVFGNLTTRQGAFFGKAGPCRGYPYENLSAQKDFFSGE